MNILVTGSNGFVGGVCSEILVYNGHNVIGIDNLSSSYKESINKDIKFYFGDIRDKNILDKIFSENSIDFVFHFAAESIIGKSMNDPAIFFDNNVSGGITLLNAMKKYGIKKIINSSTASTYGIPVEIPITENHFQLPINSYGESKLMFEKILMWYQKAYGIDYVMFRYFNVGGSTLKNGERRKEETRLLPNIMKYIKYKEPLYIFGNDYGTKDGTPVRDYLHVVDVANAHILAMENFNTLKNDTYNLGSEDGFTVLEIIKLTEKITGCTIEYSFSNRREGDPPVLIASRKKAIEKLKWNPILSNLSKIISDTWRWMQ